MPSERDLGVMVTLNNQKKNKSKLPVKLDAGIFNGQGKSEKKYWKILEDAFAIGAGLENIHNVNVIVSLIV